ncbi:MAG: glycosyltransferase family 39 protein, partial [Candidatus Omnitrophica bacterium]|nr:glycosyltransferase family 39 protein [Candidatus Omnitrophota bacterium]
MIKLYKKIDPVLILLSLIAAILLFTNLDNIYLWVDEAETAVLGRNVLTYGYPRAFDGTNTLNLLGDSWKHFAEYDQNYIWTIHPWLEFYVTAASFMLLGITTFAARFLFALAGLGSVLLSYSLSRQLFQNKTISQISTGLLVFSVPFLLHMRQCRYYALITFFTLWMMLSYLRFVKGKKYSGLELGLSSVLLFHSNYGPFISVGLAVTIHYFIFFFKREQIYKFLGVLIPVCLLTIPWLFYLKSGSHVTELSLENLRHQLEFYVRTINKYIFPLVFFILVSFYRWFRKKEKPFKETASRKPELWLLVSVILASVFLLLFVEQRIMRYMIHIVPLLYILEAVILANWLRTSRVFTICVLVILVSTNML